MKKVLSASVVALFALGFSACSFRNADQHSNLADSRIAGRASQNVMDSMRGSGKMLETAEAHEHKADMGNEAEGEHKEGAQTEKMAMPAQDSTAKPEGKEDK